MMMTRRRAPRYQRHLLLPAYLTSEAARLTGASSSTISWWFRGRPRGNEHLAPLFAPPKPSGQALSYLQLVEVAFVARFREAGVSLQRLRRARAYLAKVFETQYPFALRGLKTDGAHVYKTFEEESRIRKHPLIVADREGQEGWPDLIAERFAQFDYENDVATRWFPRGRKMPVVLDPRVAFGAPILEKGGVPTWVIVERIEAGEPPWQVQDDFSVTKEEIDFALAFERAA